MPWYHFRQNNSGGSFEGPETIHIEAKTSLEANNIAVTVGVYFNGVDDGIDCSCCGDRWRRAEDWDPTSDVPSLYGEPIDLPAPDYVLIVPSLSSLSQP
jgi:hypothetical protein